LYCYNLTDFKYFQFILGIQDVIIEDDSDFCFELTEFQSALCQSICNRFTNNKDIGEKIHDLTGKARRIVTVDVFNDPTYILATLLDPRIKVVPFNGR